MILRIFLLFAAIYLAAFVWMWTRQERYLFQPCIAAVDPAFEPYRWNPTVRSVSLQGWFLDRGKEQTVIYYGGNSEDLAGHCRVLFDGLDANALLVNYRGYGRSAGAPSERAIVADSIALFDQFCKEKQIDPQCVYLMGRSLGSGVAVQVAHARPQAAGIILVTPYESIAALARAQYPWLPLKGVLRHPFRSIEFAPRIQMSALILLAEFDAVTPVEGGRKLGAAWGGPKQMITLPATHNTIHEQRAYFETINQFIKGESARGKELREN